MDSQDLQKLREQISASTLLSQIEKTEWIQLLSEMNDTQAAELRSILESAQQKDQQHLAAPIQAAPIVAPAPVFAHPEEKTLPGGVQLASLQQAVTEQALPEHATPPQPVVVPVPTVVAQPTPPAAPIMPPPTPTPASKPVPITAPSSVTPAKLIEHARPAWQAKIVQHETGRPPVGIPDEPSPAAAAALIPSAEPATVTTPKRHEPDYPTVRNPEDLEKVNLAFLRQGDPALILNNLLHAVVEMTKTHTITQILGKIEQSPLYRIYYDTGFAALNSGALPNEQQPNAFSKEEFEAFADFRHSMEHILS